MAIITKANRGQSSLKRRIRQFYELLNDGDLARCYKMIDPQVRAKPTSVTLFQYQNALDQFLARFGPIRIQRVRIDLHVNEPADLYEGRDFAVGETTWVDRTGGRRIFTERWVREGRAWYTRSTGLVTPAPNPRK